jgi:hypothetical protein
MFTAADKATAPTCTSDATTVLVIRWSKRMRVNDATDRLFVFGDQTVCPILLRVRINSRHERCILECGVAADGDQLPMPSGAKTTRTP